MKPKTYRALIIGVGKGGQGKAGYHSIGYAHAGCYATHPRTEVVAACDLVEDHLREFHRAYPSVVTSTNLGYLLADTRPDIVSICTYAGAHRVLLKQCIDAGVKAVWCEKPLALTIDDARAMERAAAKAGVRVIVNHMRRFFPTFIHAKSLIKSGAIGEPSMVSSSIQDWDLMEWGTHWLDMIRFFADDQPVSWVMGQARCNGEKKGYGHIMEQHAIAYFAFVNGMRGFLDGGVEMSGMLPFSLRVSGSGGQLDITESNVVLTNREGCREFPVAKTGDTFNDPWQVLMNEFLGWLEGGAESQISLRNAVLSTELYLAAYESAKIGDRVDLPLGSQSHFPLEDIARRQAAR